MSDERRPPPQSTVQAAGQAASDVIGGLKQQPLVLGMVVLNTIGIAAAVWFLSRLAEAQTHRMDKLLEIIARCMPHAPSG
jgi:hypothetical protein